jgi:hypothetical protein
MSITHQNWDSWVEILLRDKSNLALFCVWTVATTVLDEASAYQKGCIYIDTDVAAWTDAFYRNTWSPAVPAWTIVSSAP